MGDQSPRQSVEIIAGTPPGGGQDRTARAIASVLGPEVRITNVPGRGGGNGWDQLLARPDETGLLGVSSPTLVTNALIGESEIDHRDLTLIAQLYTEYSVVVTPTDSRWTEPEAFLSGIAEGAVTVSFATALGNMNHLALAEIARHVGGKARSLPLRVFESARHAMADLIAGEAEAAMVSAASALPEMTDGTVTAVAVTSPRRLGGVFLGAPTWVEIGVRCEIGTWRGLVGPPGLSTETVAIWSDRLSVATTTRKWHELLEKNLWVSTYLGPAETGLFLNAERQHLASLLAETGLLEGVDGG